MHPHPGVVYWITGLAGVGKTTVGRLLAERLRSLGRPVVFLDGDELRGALFPEAGYSDRERLDLAGRYVRMCELLADQGVDVVCATISMFPEVWERNRRTLRAYREILLRAPAEVRAERKGALYRSSEPVVGRDAPAPEPPQADARIDNDGTRTPEDVVAELIERFVAHGAVTG